MDNRVSEIVAVALALPTPARAFLAEKLLESLDFEEEFEVDEEWLAVVQQRAREIDSGNVKTILAKDVFAELRNHLQ